MKNLITTILMFPALLAFSQEQFNVILEDTVSHIAIDVAESDNKFYVLSGTHNAALDNCFAISEVNINGDIQWKKLYDNDSLIVRAGWDGCLKKANDSLIICGTSLDKAGPGQAIHITRLNTEFDIYEQKHFLYDSIWKSCYSSYINDSGDILLTGAYVDTSSDEVYMLLLKLNNTLDLIWSRTFNSDYSYGSKIMECTNHDIICAGYQSSNGYSDWLINRYTNQGDLLWSKEFGWLGSRNDGAVKALVETPDSCILACGSYPGIEIISDTYYDGCIRKIDQNGELVWERFYRNYSFYRSTNRIITQFSISEIQILDDNNFIVSGSSLGCYPKNRGVLMKLSPEGEIKWHKYYYADTLTSNWQYINSSKCTSDGGFILSGYGNDYSNLGYDPPQQRWLIKTDSMGMDGLSNTEPNALQVDVEIPDTVCRADTIPVQVHIAGKSAPYTLSFSTGQIVDSIYYPPTFVPQEIGLGLVEMESGGSVYHSEDITEATITNHAWGECIVKDVDFHTPASTGDHNIQITLTDAYGETTTITKHITTKSCGNDISQETNQANCRLFPNPATNKLHLQIPNLTQTQQAEIYDASGKLVFTQSISTKTPTLDIRNLKPGNYILKVDGISKGFTVVR